MQVSARSLMLKNSPGSVPRLNVSHELLTFLRDHGSWQFRRRCENAAMKHKAASRRSSFPQYTSSPFTMKEAVVYIIDASSSMNRFYTSKETRLDCAKQAVVDSISDLMLQSKTNEVCVIVCKTKATAHHKIDPGTDLAEEEPPFPHLTELSDGIQCPTSQVLRDIASIQTDDNTDHIQQGDVIQAILLAADALYTRTHKLKFQRKIVVFTDASHNFIVQKKPFLVVVDALRDMECQIIVVGMGFDEDSAALYEAPLPVPSAVTSNGDKRPRRENADGTPYSVKVKDEPDDNDDEVLYYTEKRNREQLLVTLTEKTGGQVIAASTLQQILEFN